MWHAGRMGEPSVGSRKEEGGAQGIKSSPSATPYPPQSRKVSSAHSEEAERQGGRTPGLLRTRQGQGREGPAITIQSNPGKESKASFPIHTSPAERGMRKNPKESARQREREGEGAQTREGERGRESSPKAWGALVAVFQPAPLPPPPRDSGPGPGAANTAHRRRQQIEDILAELGLGQGAAGVNQGCSVFSSFSAPEARRGGVA